MRGCIELWLECSHHHLCWPLLVLPGVCIRWWFHLWDLFSRVLPLFHSGVHFGGSRMMVRPMSSSILEFVWCDNKRCWWATTGVLRSCNPYQIYTEHYSGRNIILRVDYLNFVANNLKFLPWSHQRLTILIFVDLPVLSINKNHSIEGLVKQAYLRDTLCFCFVTILTIQTVYILIEKKSSKNHLDIQF